MIRSNTGPANGLDHLTVLVVGRPHELRRRDMLDRGGALGPLDLPPTVLGGHDLPGADQFLLGALLSLRREDVAFDKGTALSRAEHNKGKRDHIIHLHPVVIEHLRKLPGFAPVFSPWNYRRATIITEFGAIQSAAGINPPPGRAHYAFHDLRRALPR